MSNNTKSTPAAATTALPALTKMGEALMRAIGESSFSFFDAGVTADSGIWIDVLTDEAAGAEGMPKTATGVANVVEKLVADGYLSKIEANEEDPAWVSLTAAGATCAQRLAASAEHEQQEQSLAPEPKSDDVVPLAKSTRGRNGTTKGGKTVAKKTGNPKSDATTAQTMTPAKAAAAVTKKTTPAKTTAAKAAAAIKGETTTEKKPRPSLSTKGQFVLVARKSRVTGTLVHLVNVEGEGSDMKPGKKGEKFARVCVDHKHADFHAKRSDAWNGASDPTTWCPKCKKAAAAKSGN